MKTHLNALLWVALLAVTAPVVQAEQKVDRADIRLSIPDIWVEAPDIAESVLNATKGGGDALDVSTLSYRHPSKVPIVAGVFICSRQSVGTDLRKELSDFHASMKKALEKGGATFSKFEVTETPTRMTSTFEAKQGTVKMLGVAIAAVRGDGKLLGWSVECIYAESQPLDAQTCAKVLATFQVVHPDKDLRPIN